MSCRVGTVRANANETHWVLLIPPAVRPRLFSEVQIFQWCAQLVLALTYIHSQRVVHGDLKLHNVFLTSDKIKSGVGILKVGDFGLSRTLESIGSDNKKRFAGTPHYASPEVCNGQGSSKRSDMW